MGQRARTYGSKDGSDVLGLVRIRVRLVTYLSSLAKRESSLVRRTAEDHPLSFPFRAHVSGLRARRRTVPFRHLCEARRRKLGCKNIFSMI